MTFKEKHLLPLALTAAMTMSCGENKVNMLNKAEDDSIGLLDERPLKDTDKYNTPVTLYQVDVPVYDVYGDRIEKCAVLTRGLRNSSYSSTQTVENMAVKEVYLNGAGKPCYVKADMNNAIYTNDGFSGLFIDFNMRAIIVADNNVSQFINELEEKKSWQRARSEQRRNAENQKSTVINATKPAVLKDTIASDSINTDFEHEDTLKSDTAFAKGTYSDTQFLDSLRSMKQKEI